MIDKENGTHGRGGKETLPSTFCRKDEQDALDINGEKNVLLVLFFAHLKISGVVG